MLKSESLDLSTHRKKTCLQSMFEKSSKIMEVIVFSPFSLPKSSSSRHDFTKVSSRQASVPWCFEIHASCFDEAFGKHADALGADQRRGCHLPHYWRDHLLQRDSLRHRANLHCAVGNNVDHDETRKARSSTFQANAIPTLWRWGTPARLRW